MVRGLQIFEQSFREFQEQYVLIGGTAAAITFEEEGVTFRQTKDLDIVLHIEALTSDFVERFWRFIVEGGYENCERDREKKSRAYRFSKPRDSQYPYMIELFSRKPDLVDLTPGYLAPISINAEVSSLSAILLNQEYYQYILDGRRYKEGTPPWIGADRLIPLKAQAWMDLSERREYGEQIDSRVIRKHLSDIIQLIGLLRPEEVITLPPALREDMQRFVSELSNVNPELSIALERIRRAFL